MEGGREGGRKMGGWKGGWEGERDDEYVEWGRMEDINFSKFT